MELAVLIVLLLLGSAFFAGSELAVTMASRVRLRTRGVEGDRRRKACCDVESAPSRYACWATTW
jgi:Mg2+/Co2+ transporter CorB